MQDDRSSSAFPIFPAAALVVLVVVVGAVFFFRTPPDLPPQPGPPEVQLSAAELTTLVQQKNQALAFLENSEFAKCDALLSQIVEKLPDEELGFRNLTICRLLSLETIDATRKPQEHHAALQRATVAITKLLDLNSENAINHILSSRIAGHASRTNDVFSELQAAREWSPENSYIWYELYQAGKNSEDAQLKAISRKAIQRAYELNPENLFLTIEWLLIQAESKDTEIIQSLSNTKKAVAFLVESIKQQTRFDIGKAIDESIGKVKSNDWQTVMRNVRIISNVLKPTVPTRLDLRRLTPHALGFVTHEFSQKIADQIPVTTESAIPVELNRLPEAQQPGQLSGITAVRFVDFNLDGRLDLAAVSGNKLSVFEQNDQQKWVAAAELEFDFEITDFLVADLDRDIIDPQRQPTPKADTAANGEQSENSADSGCVSADLDFVVFGPGGIRVVKNNLDPKAEKRSLQIVPQPKEFDQQKNVTAATVADIEHDGDLDLIIATEKSLRVWTNRDNFTFMDTTSRSQLPDAGMIVTSMFPVDWNRDVAIDILLAGPEMNSIGLLENSLHGRLRFQELGSKFPSEKGVSSISLADLDSNASWDIICGGASGISTIQTRFPSSEVVRFLKIGRTSESPVNGIKTWDYDNDGKTDLLAWDEKEVTIYRGTNGGSLQPVENLTIQTASAIETCDIGDIDSDGDIDLVVATAAGLEIFTNEGGNQNHWINVSLRGQKTADDPSERVNLHGVGSLLELKSGEKYQAAIVTGPVTHIGLGKHETADAVRVLWTNGIPQNAIGPAANTAICEEQILKGSCPYLYTWDGEKFVFHTDLLWAAPIGLQFAPGVMAVPREWEYLKIPGEKLVAKNNELLLQLTEELWEAAYFDEIQLIAVDHPADTEIFSNEKVGPAEIAQFKIHTVKNRKIPVAAVNHRGRNILPEIAAEDDHYLKAFETEIKQGLVEDHYLELDLGKLNNPENISLFLRGWMFPTDTSLNIAIAQNPDVAPPSPPSLSVPDENGNWQAVLPYMGFPGGKTKTIAVDLSNIFLTDDYRIRISTSMELYWDAIFFTVDERPVEIRQTKLSLTSADLHHRGFSRRTESAGNGPEHYDYLSVSTEPRWPPMQGNFTRYGDVTSLLQKTDDRLVVMSSGDEMTLRFKVPEKPLPVGWKRDYMLYNVGWDKDADLNTVLGQTVEPLPSARMQRYPYPQENLFGADPGYLQYLKTYQTRSQSRTQFWKLLKTVPSSH